MNVCCCGFAVLLSHCTVPSGNLWQQNAYQCAPFQSSDLHGQSICFRTHDCNVRHLQLGSRVQALLGPPVAVQAFVGYMAGFAGGGGGDLHGVAHGEMVVAVTAAGDCQVGWSTVYFNSVNYNLNEGAEAWAYTSYNAEEGRCAGTNTGHYVGPTSGSRSVLVSNCIVVCADLDQHPDGTQIQGENSVPQGESHVLCYVAQNLVRNCAL